MDSSVPGLHMIGQSLCVKKKFDDALYLAMFALYFPLTFPLLAFIVETLQVTLEGTFLTKCTVAQQARKLRP
jgi:hypothetical protein